MFNPRKHERHLSCSKLRIQFLFLGHNHATLGISLGKQLLVVTYVNAY